MKTYLTLISFMLVSIMSFAQTTNHNSSISVNSGQTLSISDPGTGIFLEPITVKSGATLTITIQDPYYSFLKLQKGLKVESGGQVVLNGTVILYQGGLDVESGATVKVNGYLFTNNELLEGQVGTGSLNIAGALTVTYGLIVGGATINTSPCSIITTNSLGVNAPNLFKGTGFIKTQGFIVFSGLTHSLTNSPNLTFCSPTTSPNLGTAIISCTNPCLAMPIKYKANSLKFIGFKNTHK